MPYKSKNNTNSGKFLLIAIIILVSVWITVNLSSNNIEITSKVDLKSNSIEHHLDSKNDNNKLTKDEILTNIKTVIDGICNSMHVPNTLSSWKITARGLGTIKHIEKLNGMINTFYN